jgi:hypothetical protein
VESRRNKRHFIMGGEIEHNSVIRFPGFSHSSFLRGQYENDDVKMVKSGGLRRGWRNFDFLN